MRRYAPLAALLVAAPLLSSACSDPEPDGTAPTVEPTGGSIDTGASSTTDAPSTTSTTAAPTTTSAPDPDREVLAAVRAFWDMFIEVGGRTGAFDPNAVRARLEEHSTGEQLSTLFQFFQGNAAAGYVVRGEMNLAPTVLSNDGTTAVVRDCHDDRTGVFRANDGSRVDSDDPARHQVVMTLHNMDGRWKVAEIIGEGSGCTPA